MIHLICVNQPNQVNHFTIIMHQYQLQKYNGIKSRYQCPACQNKRKTFALYINTQTNEALASHVGKCDREDKCGYHYTPKMWFAKESVSPQKSVSPKVKKLTTKSLSDLPSFGLPDSLFQQTLKAYHQNHLITFLTNTLGADATQMLIKKYRIGTAKHWPGATVFWQIDVDGKIRAGKVMLYNPATGKRVKQPHNHIAWAHKLLPVKSQHATQNKPFVTSNKPTPHNPQLTTNFKLQQCFFGEHLLAGNKQPVAIVESEKTALIASVLLPDMLWLACGGLGNLSNTKCRLLKNRKVYLYPDVNAYQQWQSKAETLMHSLRIKVSNYLELNADVSGRTNGLDIADYLLAEYRKAI